MNGFHIVEQNAVSIVNLTGGVRTIPVKVRKLHPDAVIPRYAKPGDSGFDLVAVEDVIIAPGETELVPTGLAFEIPEGYEMQIRPRSGVSFNTFLRIANTPGTIDSGFRGEVKIIVDNIAPLSVLWHDPLSIEDEYIDVGGDEYKHRAGTYIIRKGDRIAQGVIAPVMRAEFTEVAELSETERGTGGFGSTGVNAQ